MKPFLDVFPDLHITDNLRELLELVEVERVTASRDRSSIRVYIVCPRLIHKQNIYGLEKGIKDQLFPGKRVTIKIQEKFKLSEQYTPEKLLMVYKDSILMELKNYSILLYNMFRKAECSFPKHDVMEMVLEDTMIARDKMAELKRVLEKIFTERLWKLTRSTGPARRKPWIRAMTPTLTLWLPLETGQSFQEQKGRTRPFTMLPSTRPKQRQNWRQAG